jgi:hypothetical protein
MITRRARASRVTLLASVPLLALVTLAAGCGTVTTPPSAGGTGSAPPSAPVTSTPTTSGSSAGSSGSPAPVPTTTGGTITPGVPSCAGWPLKTVTERLPASFVPVAVLRCVSAEQVIPGQGQWLTETLERATTDLGPLTTALRQPPGRHAPGVMCPDIAMLPPQIVLISDNGATIVPRFPLSGCGLVQGQVLGALAALSWKPVTVRLVSQVQTQAEVASGCTAQYKDPFLLYGTPRPSPGGEVYTTRPASLRICVYSASGANTSQFLRGTTVTGQTENVLLSGLSGARGSNLCTLPHSKFAVVEGGSPNAATVYVELGGCDRVFRYQTGSGGLMGMSTGQATTAAVAIIEQVTHPTRP